MQSLFVRNRALAAGLATIGAYALIGALALLGLVIYKSGSGQSPLSGRLGWLFGTALVALIGAFGALVLAVRHSEGDRRSGFWFPVCINVVLVFVGLLLAEVSLRVITRPDRFGVGIGSTSLLPYDWNAVVQTNLTNLRFTRQKTSFYVEDPLLGWTIGPDRESQDGMYKSSMEGLRSGQRGVSFSSAPANNRIALFGDSFTFGLEVPFEQSWSDHLERSLGNGEQVLNFGVDGYGLDQAYLRFKRDVSRWAPRISVLSFIQDDLNRDFSVYPFLRGWDYPFSKPRFFLDGSNLVLQNVPTMPPDDIVAKRSIWDLPFIEQDINFFEHQWRQHRLYALYLTRLIATASPNWSFSSQPTDEANLQLGRRLIEEFIHAARVQNTEPLIVYLPSRVDFDADHPSSLGRRLQELLRVDGFQLHILTPCLAKQASEKDLFLEGKAHYSNIGNMAAAKCIEPLIVATPAIRSGE